MSDEKIPFGQKYCEEKTNVEEMFYQANFCTKTGRREEALVLLHKIVGKKEFIEETIAEYSDGLRKYSKDKYKNPDKEKHCYSVLCVHEKRQNYIGLAYNMLGVIEQSYKYLEKSYFEKCPLGAFNLAIFVKLCNLSVVFNDLLFINSFYIKA